MMRSKRGFTLVEVMVALGIAAGALVLLLSANRESLRRSVNSRSRAHLDQLAQSKLDELRLGLEMKNTGGFQEFPEYRWDATEESSGVEDLENLKRLDLRIRNSEGRIVQTLQAFTYRPEVKKQ